MDEDITVQDIYESLTEIQKQCLHYIVGTAVKDGLRKATITALASPVYDSFSEIQKRVARYIVKEVVKDAESKKT